MVKLLLENFEFGGKVKRGVVARTSPRAPEHPHVRNIYEQYHRICIHYVHKLWTLIIALEMTLITIQIIDNDINFTIISN